MTTVDAALAGEREERAAREASKLRRRPLTSAVLRGLEAVVTMGHKDLEGVDEEWLDGKVFAASRRDVEAAVAWLDRERLVRRERAKGRP